LKTLAKSLIVGGVLGTVGLTSIAGVHIASAETAGGSASSDPMSSLVQKIATKFNLNKDDVQKVFDEDKAAREAEHDKQVDARLQKLVDAGTITSAQKTAIENKLKELKEARQADREEMKTLSDTERQSKMDERKNELESWAKEQGIDLTKLKGIFGGGPGGPR
jgi:competence protein ComGC